VLPDQRIENGVVIYRVVEGRLTDIEVTGTDWLRPGYVRDRLARAAGPPVNVEAVERRVELLLQDPAIARMNVELVPGAAPGEARLLARVTEKKPYSLVATIANDEPPTVGSVRGELAGVLRSLTGWGDTLALRYGRTAGVNQGGVAWAVPVTAADTTVAVRWDYDGAAVVSETFSGLDIRSTTTTYGVAVSQPVYRTPRQALTLSLGFDSRSNDTTLLGEPFSFSPGFVNGHARASILRFSQEWLDRRADQVLALRSTFSRGLGLLGATHSGQQPDANFTVWLGQAQYVHTVFGDSQIIARTDVQLSRDPLFPFEQIAIGGAGTVRGYRENTLVRDSGVIASLEGRIPVAKLPLPAISTGDNDGTLQLAPFVDYGTGWNKRSPTPRPRDLSSVGVGLRWEVSDRLSMQLYYGYALRHIHVTGRDLQDNGIHFRLVARAF
jgi:hemolysin activation/secretion protein